MTHTQTAGPYGSIAEISEANAGAGKYFFTPASMRFFRSRIAPGVIGGRYFVTSERFVGSDGYTAPREYTVRVANDDGTIDTVGDFGAFPTLAEARAAARALVTA